MARELSAAADGEGSPMAVRKRQVVDAEDPESTVCSTVEASQTLTGKWPNMPMEQDTFGMTIGCLVRDFYYLSRGRGTARNRWSRIMTTMLLLVLCVALQVFLLVQVKHFVCAKAVHDIRIAYDAFQHTMYGGHTKDLFTDPILERRGIGGPPGPYWNASYFDKLAPEEQASACRIPLSQPVFFFCVLYIWTLTCVSEVRKCKDLLTSLVLQTATIEDMAESLEPAEDDDDGFCKDTEEALLVGLTKGVKAMIVFGVLVPRFLVASVLLWIGCRWLLATASFSDLILNAVALEFVLSVKDLLYMAIMPRRNMISIENLFVRVANPERESCVVFASVIGWAGLAAVWVLAYMGIPGHNGWQMVLRGYQWDVHKVCEVWINKRYAV